MNLGILKPFQCKPRVVSNNQNRVRHAPHIVIGVTSSQTCLVLDGRLRALRESGFHVTLIASPGAMLDRVCAGEGIDGIGLPLERGIAPLADLASLIRLWRLLRRLRPDIAEFSTPKAGLLGMLAATLARVPRRVYLLRGLKLESGYGFKRSLLCIIERIATACAHVVLCNSPSLCTEALAIGIAPAHKLHILGSGSSKGVDIERFQPGPSRVRQRFGIPQDAHVTGFVGRFTYDKGIPALIDAFDRILQNAPHTYLLMIGWFDRAEDAICADLRRRIASHPRIVCTGFIADAAPYYRAMDLLILPTLREGFPNVVLEASASGVPVITTRCTGARDSVVHGQTGLFVSADPYSICDAALTLLRDPIERRRMGTAGRDYVASHFRDQRIYRLTIKFYRELLRPAALNAPQPAMDWAVPSR